MANLKDVQLRIKTVAQTLQVTKAMNLISTAKVRKGRRILTDTEPFFKRIHKSMYDILSASASVKSGFLYRAPKPDAAHHSAVIVVTSDKGLAGGYNANIYHAVNDICKNLKNPILILIGTIGTRYFAHYQYPILESFTFKSRLPEMHEVKELTDYVISQYVWDVFDEVHIVYTHMFNSVKMTPTVLQLLPLNAETVRQEIATMIGSQKKEELQFEYLPSEKDVFDALVPFYIKGIIYSSLVEAYVSEQNARMSAMNEASNNAEDMLNELRISHNRVRQAGITREITEIVSGSAALME